MAKIIAVLGSTGHFGKIIYRHLLENLEDCQFYLLTRKIPAVSSELSSPVISCFYYDYKINSEFPDFPRKPDLLLDLTGPVEQDDLIVFEACLLAGIPYMDISMNVRHLENCQKFFNQKHFKKYKSGLAIIHTGLFPGFSNLIIAELVREMPRNTEFTLAGEFPAYAGGGYKVAQTMENLLQNLYSGYFISGGKKITHNLHEGAVAEFFNGKRKNMYRWFLPEMTCLAYSIKPYNFNRLIVIKPWILNPVFSIMVKILKLSGNNKWLINIIKWNVFMLKKYFFKKFSPSIRMEAIGQTKNSVRRIALEIKDAVPFHGAVMLGFVKAFLKMSKRKKLAGLFTPEQFFKTEDILEYGKFKDYLLEKFETGT